MTKREALQIVTEALNIIDRAIFTDVQNAKINDALDVIANMREQLTRTRVASEDDKAFDRQKRADARAEAIKNIVPVVLAAIDDTPKTVKEIFAACKANLPSDWTAAKVQYLLLHELAYTIEKTGIKGKPNTYTRKK